jgi:hypothetical protein
LWSAVRVVTKTACVSLFGNSFEVDAALVGRKAELIFDPLPGIPGKGSYVRDRVMGFGVSSEAFGLVIVGKR